jgi:hypothetical protein
MGECYVHAPCGVFAAIAAPYNDLRAVGASGTTGEST